MFLSDIHSSGGLEIIHKVESSCHSKLQRPSKLLDSVVSCSRKAKLSARLVV